MHGLHNSHPAYQLYIKNIKRKNEQGHAWATQFPSRLPKEKEYNRQQCPKGRIFAMTTLPSIRSPCCSICMSFDRLSTSTPGTQNPALTGMLFTHP
ncbi:hypothetical protein LguiA_018516 [Lonicera macranthoides]